MRTSNTRHNKLQYSAEQQEHGSLRPRADTRFQRERLAASEAAQRCHRARRLRKLAGATVARRPGCDTLGIACVSSRCRFSVVS